MKNSSEFISAGVIAIAMLAMSIIQACSEPKLEGVCKPAVVAAVRGYNLLPPEVHVTGACGEAVILSGSMAMTLAAQYNEGDTIQ